MTVIAKKSINAKMIVRNPDENPLSNFFRKLGEGTRRFLVVYGSGDEVIHHSFHDTKDSTNTFVLGRMKCLPPKGLHRSVFCRHGQGIELVSYTEIKY